VLYLRARGMCAYGFEPVSELIEQAHRKGLPRGLIARGDGYRLPFADNSFDAVCECGMLHHVEQPGPVVREMMRVARRAVFLSDENPVSALQVDAAASPAPLPCPDPQRRCLRFIRAREAIRLALAAALVVLERELRPA